jgi:hypothetical protein
MVMFTYYPDRINTSLTDELKHFHAYIKQICSDKGQLRH